MTKLTLPTNPTLAQFQKYVKDMCKERGFSEETLAEVYILFSEEAGELARVVRKTSGMKTDVTAKDFDAGGELTDLLIYLLHMANILGIDLEAAFRAKEAKNKQRTWA